MWDCSVTVGAGTTTRLVSEDPADNVTEAARRLEAGDDPDDVLAWLHDRGASLPDAMHALGRAHIEDPKLAVWRHRSWTEESVQHRSYEDACLAVFDGMSIGGKADPDFEAKLEAATSDQRRHIIEILLADVTTDAALAKEQSALADALRHGSAFGSATLVAVQNQRRELELANARATIARIQEGERGGCDQTIWPSVRTGRCLAAFVEARQADDSDSHLFAAAVFAALGDANDASSTAARILTVLSGPPGSAPGEGTLDP